MAYRVHGPLRDVLLCHCEECRRWGGYLGAFTATRLEDFELAQGSALRWIESPDSDRHALRGFCRVCGSSLFWQPREGERIHIAAGTLDRPTGLRVAGHWYAHQAGDWDELPDDGLPDPSTIDVRWS